MEIRNFCVSSEKHTQRQTAHLKSGHDFICSYQNFQDDFSKISCGKEKLEAKSIIRVSPKDFSIPFGAVNTLAKGGCIVYVTYQIGSVYRPEKFQCSLATWTEEIVNKGYRSWKFSECSKSFITPNVNIENVKMALKNEVVNIDNCVTVEDLEKKLGKVIGIGGSQFAIDNIIADLSGCEPVVDTRLHSIEAMLRNLEDGILVPIRVNNSIYKGNNNSGGHYVILEYIHDGIAVIIDSARDTKYEIPLQQLLNSIVADENLIAVWDLRKLENN